MLHHDLLHGVLTVLLGVVTGVMSAAFGVGGAVISTPGLRVLGLTALLAVGTTLPAVLPSAVTGTLRYTREHLIEWRVVAWTTPAGAVAAVSGSLLSHVVPGHGHWLMLLTAGLLGFTAWRMAKTPRHPDDPPPEAEDDATAAFVHPDPSGPSGPSDPSGPSGPSGSIPSFGSAGSAHPSGSAFPPSGRHDRPAVLVAIGIGAGLLSGLLGVGGGIVMVPGFTEIARIPLKTAIATSLACVGIFALPGTLTHWRLGDIDWWAALLLSVGVIPGARLGAHLAIRAKDHRLRISVAAFLGLTSVIYAAGEVLALKH